jgi:hypothetical protein
LETSWCSASGFMPTEVGSSNLRHASIVSWQAIVSFRHSLREWIVVPLLGIFCRSALASYSPGFGSIFSGLASIISWQAILSFW